MGGLLGFLPGGGGSHLCVRATGADGVKVSGHQLGDAGVATIGEVGGLPGVGVGLGESRGVSVADVVHSVNPGEVWIKGGAIVFGGSWGGGFILGLGSDGRGGLRSQGGTEGGSAYPI